MFIAYRTIVRYNERMKKKGKPISFYIPIIELFYTKHRRMPSYEESAKIFGFKSKDSAFRIIKQMILKRILDKDKNGKLIPIKSKTFKTKTESLGEGLALLGLVEAGFPTPAEENNLDRIMLDDWLIDDRDSSFMLKVKGESMRDAGIRAGDFVIVERTNVPKVGAIIIAEVDQEWTIKYLRKDSKGYYLEPANPDFKIIRPKEDLKISAIVKAVVRKY